MKHKRAVAKPWRSGWKEVPHKPLTPAAKQRRVEWLASHSRYLSQLMFSEAER